MSHKHSQSPKFHRQIIRWWGINEACNVQKVLCFGLPLTGGLCYWWVCPVWVEGQGIILAVGSEQSLSRFLKTVSDLHTVRVNHFYNESLFGWQSDGDHVSAMLLVWCKCCCNHSGCDNWDWGEKGEWKMTNLINTVPILINLCIFLGSDWISNLLNSQSWHLIGKLCVFSTNSKHRYHLSKGESKDPEGKTCDSRLDSNAKEANGLLDTTACSIWQQWSRDYTTLPMALPHGLEKQVIHYTNQLLWGRPQSHPHKPTTTAPPLPPTSKSLPTSKMSTSGRNAVIAGARCRQKLVIFQG